MSFILNSGPHITSLPNPVLGNTVAIRQTVDTKLTMDKTFYTYKSAPAPSRKLRFEYVFENVGHEKIVELQEFYKVAGGESITITTQDSISYLVLFVDDPNATISKRANPVGSPTGRSETGGFTLTFVEV